MPGDLSKSRTTTSSKMSLSQNQYSGVVQVTIAFLLMYYAFLFGQSFMKHKVFKELKKQDPSISFGKVKYGQGIDRRCTAVDRAVGNTMEQAIPFLTTLWLCAVFGDPGEATALGWSYIFFRAFYPFVFYKGGIWLLMSTVPGYLIIIRLVVLATA